MTHPLPQQLPRAARRGRFALFVSLAAVLRRKTTFLHHNMARGMNTKVRHRALG